MKLIQRAGLQVQGGFIVGFDSDTPSIFQRQIEFIQKSGIVTAMVGLLQAPPGTRLYERMRKEGRLLGLISGDNVDGTTNIFLRWATTRCVTDTETSCSTFTRQSPTTKRAKTFLREYKPRKSEFPWIFNAWSVRWVQSSVWVFSARNDSSIGRSWCGRFFTGRNYSR